MAVRFNSAHFPQDIILPWVRWYVGLSPQYAPY
jgi:transposase-like protein